MATTTTSRPGRHLIVLGVILVLLFGIMAITKTGAQAGSGPAWWHHHHADGRVAAGGGQVTAEQLSEAKNIISQRVNGAGVGEAEITTAGANHITVAVPGCQPGRPGQAGRPDRLLYFRVVYGSQPGAPAPTTPRRRRPTGSRRPRRSRAPRRSASTTASRPRPATPKGRAWQQRARAAPTPTPTPTPPAKPSDPGRHAVARSRPTGDPLQWQPDAATQAAFARLHLRGQAVAGGPEASR